MFGSQALDVAIGMALLFLFASLICTSIVEALEGVLKHRAMDLERGLREMFDDRDGTTITRSFFDHPLIYGLFSGTYDPAGLKPMRHVADLLKKPRAADEADRSARILGLGSRRELPSYIPAGSFATALLDIVARGAVNPDTPPSLAAPTTESLRAGVVALPSIRLQRTVLAALDAGQGDVERTKQYLEQYYDATMDRVSGWYKRRTQLILFIIGLLMAASLNIDAITIAWRLNNDPALRAAAVSAAEKVTADSGKTADAQFQQLQTLNVQELQKTLGEIGYPLGWSPMPQMGFDGAKPDQRCLVGSSESCHLGLRLTAAMVAGWVITALAVMLGAPFWFDLLNKLMVIRSTVKPSEKAGTEAPKDPQPRPTPQVVAPPGAGQAAPATGAPPQPDATPPMPFQPNQWKDDRPEGVL